MFDQFTEWEHNRHDYARAWKERTGGKERKSPPEDTATSGI